MKTHIIKTIIGLIFLYALTACETQDDFIEEQTYFETELKENDKKKTLRTKRKLRVKRQIMEEATDIDNWRVVALIPIEDTGSDASIIELSLNSTNGEFNSNVILKRKGETNNEKFIKFVSEKNIFEGVDISGVLFKTFSVYKDEKGNEFDEKVSEYVTAETNISKPSFKLKKNLTNFRVKSSLRLPKGIDDGEFDCVITTTNTNFYNPFWEGKLNLNTISINDTRVKFINKNVPVTNDNFLDDVSFFTTIKITNLRSKEVYKAEFHISSDDIKNLPNKI